MGLFLHHIFTESIETIKKLITKIPCLAHCNGELENKFVRDTITKQLWQEKREEDIVKPIANSL